MRRHHDGDQRPCLMGARELHARESMLAPPMRVLAVGHLYPPHHFGGYELVWRSAMRHLERNGHQALVLTSDLDIGAAEPDDPNVRRELRLYWRPHHVIELGALGRLRLERHNARILDRYLRDFAPDVVSWWSILHVGRIDERKGIHTAVAALTHLPPEATLTIIGSWDEGESSRLRAIAERNGVLERVRFEGQRSAARVWEAYAEADVVVFPVVWEEPWGLVPIEAMGRGR